MQELDAPRCCIGIISWFPDNIHRSERVNRCKKLIDECNRILDLPIIVIAQNWGYEIAAKNLLLYRCPKLGITNARKKLWEVFLDGDKDWMILFDDDCELVGTRRDGKRFLRFLNAHGNGYVCAKRNEFKLCAIHRAVATEHKIPNLDVEDGTGIEDYGFFERLRLMQPQLEIAYDFGGLKETSIWSGDITSCWSRSDIGGLIQKTNKFIFGEKTNG